MKTIVLTTLLVLGSWGSLTHIRDRNAAIRQAEAAYAKGDFRLAALAYRKAVEQLGARDEAVVLNLAHACVLAGQPAEARGFYGRLLTSRQPHTRSIARQQLAVLAAQKGDYAQAVALLRKALLADPTNAGARYNYEALKAYLDRRRQEPQLPPPASAADDAAPDPQSPASRPRPQPGPDQPGLLDDPTQPTDPRSAPRPRPDQRGQRDPARPKNSAGTGAKGGFQLGQGNRQAVAQGTQAGQVRGLSNDAGEVRPPTGAPRTASAEQAALNETQLQTQRERLQQMNLSSGQARQLLEALNAAEQQYLQQLPHKSARKPDSGKPAW
ncbi:Tetratricopeptide repeat-containing protein [Hymenobacter daecheongensis DSM 21074]|uniref:Tetratricopeptide repeat-containing protein n=1 Tax=Hymenobacter daecheongensis DSM 21074 TaxID=1121955 RepID=A0A1M6EE20_9BACT|nr:tetratricopeptide repeat protein [Hymenobacter daecheongensis]SHI83671.1 Tetratricopeptide repeat-containing protein [Hymenobacter daecheongensis DSM 21074]